ncbi:sodium/calcium exchanger NCL1-like protein [Tanacetum coccineum]
MEKYQGLCLFLVVLMTIGNVKGRWLDNSDGVHDINNTNQNNDSFLRMSVPDQGPKKLDASGNRCQPIYGFLPCADTVQEGIFLIVMYTYVLMLGEDWLKKGSKALLIHFMNQSIAGSVFRVLMALPRIVLVIASGALATQSDAQNQVAFGVAMYAGSTVITLTGIWGVNVIINKEKLSDDASNQVSSSRLSFFKDEGVKIRPDTRNMASIMLLSLIPFVFVVHLQVYSDHTAILFSLIISGTSMFSYIAYQIASPWIQANSVASVSENLFQEMFLMKLQESENESLFTDDLQPNIEAIQSIFKSRDHDKNDNLTWDELEKLIKDKFNEEDTISRAYALEEFTMHFDKDNTKGVISMEEFEVGCTTWLNKWKKANNGFVSKNNLNKYVIVPKSFAEPLISNFTVNGEIDENKIQELFQDDMDNDGEMNPEELENAIMNLRLANHNPGAFAKNMIKYLDKDNNGTINKNEVIKGIKEWTGMAKRHASKNNENLLTHIWNSAIESFGVVDNKEEPKRNMLYILLGAATLYLFSGPFMQSVIQFSNALEIPFLFTSFVVAPFFMNARSMVIFAFSPSHKEKSNINHSLPFFELYSGLVMNNLMGLTTLLAIVYIKGLTWVYTAEVITIIVIGLIMGTFARICSTYHVWTSILSFFLYVTTISIFCVYAWERD